MTLWRRTPDLPAIMAMQVGTMSAALGIEVTTVTGDSIIARMPVDHRTRQPHGRLNGGASVALARDDRVDCRKPDPSIRLKA